MGSILGQHRNAGKAAQPSGENDADKNEGREKEDMANFHRSGSTDVQAEKTICHEAKATSKRPMKRNQRKADISSLKGFDRKAASCAGMFVS